MNKTVIASVALVALGTGIAGAADLPVKAPSMAPVVAPWSWSGCYVGGTAGGAWQRLRTDLAVTNNPTAGYFLPPVIPSVNASGSGPLDRSGFTGGGEVGCNWQTGQWVWGLEVDAESLSLKRNFGGQFFYPPPPLANGGPYFLTVSSSTDWMFTVRPRVGVAFDRALLFVTGGLAVTNLKFNQAFAEPPFTPTPELATLSTTKLGWVVGGGLEYALGGGWTVKGEYLYARFNADSAVGQLVNAAGSGPGCPGTATSFTCGATFTNNLSNLTVQIARAGINYKFDWGGPVRAAY